MKFFEKNDTPFHQNVRKNSKRDTPFFPKIKKSLKKRVKKKVEFTEISKIVKKKWGILKNGLKNEDGVY